MGAERIEDLAKSKGYDKLTCEQRRDRARELLDRSDLTEEENDELDVLLLMARGLSEGRARVDVVMRKRRDE